MNINDAVLKFEAIIRTYGFFFLKKLSIIVGFIKYIYEKKQRSASVNNVISLVLLQAVDNIYLSELKPFGLGLVDPKKNVRSHLYGQQFKVFTRVTRTVIVYGFIIKF